MPGKWILPLPMRVMTEISCNCSLNFATSGIRGFIVNTEVGRDHHVSDVEKIRNMEDRPSVRVIDKKTVMNDTYRMIK